VLFFGVLTDGLSQELSNVVKNLVSRGVVFHHFCDLLVLIDETFFRSFSDYNHTKALLFNSFYHTLVESVRATELKWELWDQSEVDLVSSHRGVLCDEATVPAHQFDDADTVALRACLRIRCKDHLGGYFNG